jgi:hypothetical protein
MQMAVSRNIFRRVARFDDTRSRSFRQWPLIRYISSEAYRFLVRNLFDEALSGTPIMYLRA